MFERHFLQKSAFSQKYGFTENLKKVFSRVRLSMYSNLVTTRYLLRECNDLFDVEASTSIRAVKESSYALDVSVPKLFVGRVLADSS